MLDGANTINAITEAYNNALKKKYNLENNSFIINNPVDEIQQNISKVMVKGALSAANNIYQEGKKAIQWGKDVKNDFPKLLLTYKYGIARYNLMLYNKKISRKIFYEKKVINYIWNTNFSFYNFAHNTNC